MDIIDLKGRKFGLLTVKKYVGKTGLYKCKKYGTEKGYHTWKCECECGNIVNVRSNKLRSGHSKSCGCKRKMNKPKWTLPEGEAAKNLLLQQYKQSAKKRDLDFSIDRDKFTELTSSNCHYCDSKPSESVAMRQKGKSKHRSLNGDYLYNGLDRVNNNIGYTVENCVPCCWICNEMKSNKNKEDFIEHIRKIVENLYDK